MRKIALKIALKIAEAIKAGRSVTIGNTSFDAQYGIVALHGNRILYRLDGVYRVDLRVCREWQTVTTRSRVNDICVAMGGPWLLAQRDFSLVVNTKEGERLACTMETDPIAFEVVPPRPAFFN